MGGTGKYPRTLHLPWSEGVSSDDRVLRDVSIFAGHDVVVTEKVDGENTSIYGDGSCHARSVDSRDHPSRHPVKALAASLGYRLPPDLRLVGENAYAKHTIPYRELPAYFLAFAATAGGFYLSWDETAALCTGLGLETVPVLYRGPWDERAVRACQTGTSRCGGVQEGYVVRLASSFSEDAFGLSVAKFVRAGHVQEDKHWMYGPVVPNGLA